ncbi:TetR/AcrR family transcriptional regulator [Asticcacaulis solisilvae]|uniref:TetR/AcrR family transcriptional regulator n=1 Tax=Asticcacaulis solisilvae TaxID=1217274 RepID=UPI003FD86658
MSSQKSTREAPAGKAPTRERGRLRVAALMDAGAEVIATRGYAAATMTEIAARAGASIGSLYQFFPSKEALGDALLRRYGERMEAALDALLARAAGISAAGIADGLVAVMTGLRDDRAAALTLIEARDDLETERKRLKALMLERIEAILSRALPELGGGRTGPMALMLLYVLKSVPALLADRDAKGAAMGDEVRRLIRLYMDA